MNRWVPSHRKPSCPHSTTSEIHAVHQCLPPPATSATFYACPPPSRTPSNAYRMSGPQCTCHTSARCKSDLVSNVKKAVCLLCFAVAWHVWSRQITRLCSAYFDLRIPCVPKSRKPDVTDCRFYDCTQPQKLRTNPA